MEVSDLRKQFRGLSRQVYGKPLVYLDNAATAQRPDSVIDKWNEMSVSLNANLHRAVHFTAEKATQEYESTRETVRKFINAASADEIVFTSGATMSINLVAFTYGEKFVCEGDEIMVAQSEHHSDLVPWQQLCIRKNALLSVIPVDAEGKLDLEFVESHISCRTKLVCVAHISNVLGLTNPLKKLATICHSVGCKLFADGAQGIVHCPVDVRDLDCDFYVFSGHKIYAAPWTGVLYARKEILESMPPFMTGGEMIDTVSFEKTEFAPVPRRFEAGTQNIAGVPTLKPALETALLMRDPSIEAEQRRIVGYMLDYLGSNTSIRLFGKPDSADGKIPLFSFSVEGVHHEDLALLLDKMGVAVRSGQMCAEPLMDRYGVTGMLRASFAPYNTLEESEYFVKCLEKAIRMLR